MDAFAIEDYLYGACVFEFCGDEDWFLRLIIEAIA
jgi:hypothetical protein